MVVFRRKSAPFVGCVLAISACAGPEDEIDSIFQEASSCAANLQTANNYTYGEIRSWACAGNNCGVPTGLGDAKASIFAACLRNTSPLNCACVAQPSATAAFLDRAAWNNISSASGTDRSNSANYFCVGHQNCSIVTSCALPMSTATKVSRQLQPVSTVNVGSNPLYFYRDQTLGMCFRMSSGQSCSSIVYPTAGNNWTASCTGTASSFTRGTPVMILARFTSLTVNHRFAARVFRNNVLQYEVPPTGYNVVGSGWEQAYFWHQVQANTSGTWKVQVRIDPGNATFYDAQVISFTVS
jgi:hypothetical protein